MRTITVKLEDRFAVEVERFQREMGYATRSELVRDALGPLCKSPHGA